MKWTILVKQKVNQISDIKKNPYTVTEINRVRHHNQLCC